MEKILCIHCEEFKLAWGRSLWKVFGYEVLKSWWLLSYEGCFNNDRTYGITSMGGIM